MRRERRQDGFTLIEAIVASVILCISVLVLSVAGVKSLSQVRLNRQYSQAVELAQKQLVIIDYMGIDGYLESGQMEGEFDDGGVVFHWSVESGSADIDGLYAVKVFVRWVERRRNYQVGVESRFNGSVGADAVFEAEES